MKVCGVDISGSEARLVVVEGDANGLHLCELETKKIALKDDEINEQVRSFHQVVLALVRENKIEKIAIKKRMKTGGFASGPVSFKIEGLFQMIAEADVVFIAPNTISAFEKKNGQDIPIELNKYQTDAYRTARVAILKG
ncbi:DUF3010 family protein [Telluria mixta]|uniref:DUF3010 family protein n=1 Tax=Telluria mixta TaxID=34071 RepID=A0ABT2C2P6_9BURK|nr:DUF3010 family protein [Telluria mixta]MCS0631660.1 DUF3010 family protein [Telluria mixta]WEM98410.1 DUF3010 family protein [Telluria mixta]